MCGIIGVAGELTVQHEKLVRSLLILDSLRGEDSTGIAVIGKQDPRVKIAKQVGDPFQLFDHKSYDKAFAGFQRAIIGHNRYATTGVVNRNNAHPFEHETLVGVHNGTLTTKHLLADPSHYQVDSDNLFHHIDKHGLKDALPKMGGAWALVWWNKDDSTLNFLRNKERPLFLTFSKDQKQIFWASEHWMLSAALNKHGMAYDPIEMVPEDLHISFYIDDKGVLGKPIARRAASSYVAPVYQKQANWSNNNPVQTVGKITAETTTLGVVPPVKKEEPVTKAPEKKPEVVYVESCEKFYLSCKNRRLETMNAAKDSKGRDYISCFDPKRQYFDIRLYAPPGSGLWDTIGCDIFADVMGFFQEPKSPGRGYYTLNPMTACVMAPLEEKEPEELKLMGPSGKWITEKDFKVAYPSCAYCSDNLVFGAYNRFTTGGECVCPSCSKDPAVLEMVSLH